MARVTFYGLPDLISSTIPNDIVRMELNLFCGFSMNNVVSTILFHLNNVLRIVKLDVFIGIIIFLNYFNPLKKFKGFFLSLVFMYNISYICIMENNTSSLIRQIRIAMIADTPNYIVKWFYHVWDQLYHFRDHVYGNDGVEYIYYIESDNYASRKWVFYLNEDSGILYYNYNNFGNSLCHHFNLIPDEADAIIKELFDNASGKPILSSATSSSDNSIIATTLNLYKGPVIKNGKTLTYVKR